MSTPASPQPGVRQCPACRDVIDPDRASWRTAYGSTCTESCARDLVRQHEGGIHR